VSYPTDLAQPVQIRKALSLYRVMAIVAGIALFILIVEMVMKYGMGQQNFLTHNWSYIHGFIYMAYAASIANLGLKLAWSLKRIVLHLLTGFVPLLPFVAERRVTAETEGILARRY
jgi:integral membrane protein